ncbi:hypothetical protein O181_100585 [Austropuccinia psidii MF-1]|uniref:Uncharacterized protein n=1 Tax=Austropuccinia psidii MF-1 TaxID=1389203 RepID=A0A9Q3PH02_9BASI|nr:hypothetical protein [Austropuccinia psidii MF-1]
MSSRLTSLFDSNYSDSPPSVLYGPGFFDKLRELSEESMAPTEIYYITRNYNGFKSVRVIEPPCTNCQRKGLPCVEYATARSTRCKFCNLGKRNCSQASYSFPENPRRLWSSIKKCGKFGLEAPFDEPPTSGHSNLTGSRMRGVQQSNNTSSSWESIGGTIHPQGNPIEVAPEVPILVTRKDLKLGKLKRNLVAQDEIDTDAEGSDAIDGEELELTTPIPKRRIQSPSKSPVQASTTNHEVIRSPQPPQILIRSPTRPSTLASASTSIQQPVASTSRDPISPEPESIFETRFHWNITGNFTDQKKVNKKVDTALFAGVDALTEVLVHKAMKSAIPGEPTIALAKKTVAYEDAMVVKLREALKKF